MLGPRCISLRPAVEAVAAPPMDTTLAIATARLRVVTTTTIVIIPATRARVQEVLVVVAAAGEAIAIRRSPSVTYLRARRFTNSLVNEQNRVVFLFLRLCRFFCCCFLLLEPCIVTLTHTTRLFFASAAAELTTHKQRHRYMVHKSSLSSITSSISSTLPTQAVFNTNARLANTFLLKPKQVELRNNR